MLVVMSRIDPDYQVALGHGSTKIKAKLIVLVKLVTPSLTLVVSCTL